MLTLYTGLPGSSKTLTVITEHIDIADRQVYYHGITDCSVPGWVELESPAQWADLPTGSIFIIDECQKHFPVRGPSAKTPNYVSALETHRHLGIDLIFITQHPRFLDAHVRRLIGRHIHMLRAFGMNSATRIEWEGCQPDPLDYNAQKLAVSKKRLKFNKKIYDFYKSAEIHTVKRRIPFKLILIPVLFLFLAVAIFFVFSFVSQLAGSDSDDSLQAGPSSSVNVNAQAETQPRFHHAAHSNSKMRAQHVDDWRRIVAHLAISKTRFEIWVTDGIRISRHMNPECDFYNDIVTSCYIGGSVVYYEDGPDYIEEKGGVGSERSRANTPEQLFTL